MVYGRASRSLQVACIFYGLDCGLWPKSFRACSLLGGFVFVAGESKSAQAEAELISMVDELVSVGR